MTDTPKATALAQLKTLFEHLENIKDDHNAFAFTLFLSYPHILAYFQSQEPPYENGKPFPPHP